MKPDPRKIRGYRWALLMLFMLCSSSVMWYSFAIGLVLPDMRRELGLSPSQEGWLSASFYLAAFVFTIPVSNLLSRFPPVPVMVCVLGGTTALLFGAAYLPGYPAQVGVRFLISLLFIASHPARTLLIHHWFRPQESGSANAVFNAMYGIIVPISFWGSAPIIGWLGWRGMFWFLGMLSIALTATWTLLARDAPVAREAPALLPADRPARSPLAVIWRRETWFLAMISFGGDFAWSSWVTFWPTLAQDTHGFSAGLVGLLLGLSAVMVLPGSLLSPLVVRLLRGQRPVFILFTLLQVPTYAALALADSVPVLATCAVLQGLWWIYGPVLNAAPFLIPRLSPREVAVMVAVLIVARTGAQTLGPTLAGILAETYPLRTVLTVTAMGPFVATAGALLLGDITRVDRPRRGAAPIPSANPAPVH